MNCTDVLFDGDCRKKIGVKIGYTETCGDFFTLQDGGTPLIYAAAIGNIENIVLLIQEGADVNLIRTKRTALGMAAQSGSPECVKYLIEAGANVNVVDPAVKPALMYAVQPSSISGDREKCVEMLIKAGADVNVIHCGTTALAHVAQFEQLKCVNLLIEAGANVNVPSVRSPLMNVISASPFATLEYREKCVEMLIKAGADVNLGHKGYFPLDTALSCKYFECVKILIHAGADVNKRNDVGQHPLHLALHACAGKSNLRLLLDSGAEVNAEDQQRITVLMKAVDVSSKLLIERSCEYYRHQKPYREPYHSDKVRCCESVCLLLEAGAQINRKSFMGENALMIACSYLHPDVDEDQSDLYKLLHAAGETIDGPIRLNFNYLCGYIKHIEIPEYFQELKENLDLKDLCREAIRKHLIDVDPHENLFVRIPRLGLPSLIVDYLLYDCSLDCEKAIEEDV